MTTTKFCSPWQQNTLQSSSASESTLINHIPCLIFLIWNIWNISYACLSLHKHFFQQGTMGLDVLTVKEKSRTDKILYFLAKKVCTFFLTACIYCCFSRPYLAYFIQAKFLLVVGSRKLSSVFKIIYFIKTHEATNVIKNTAHEDWRICNDKYVFKHFQETATL